MRFLFVVQDIKVIAERLLNELCVDDVKIILARRGDQEPRPEELALLKSHGTPSAAVCQVERRYRRHLSHIVKVEFEAKRLRCDDLALKAWLSPPESVTEVYLSPRTAFLEAAQKARSLVVSETALELADKLPRHRWKFASRAAHLLAQLSEGANLGPMREWKPRHGIDFAANGSVIFHYDIVPSMYQGIRDGKTEWHLKEGDRTSRESAARIYFNSVPTPCGTIVLLLYVGPHPENGTRRIRFNFS